MTLDLVGLFATLACALFAGAAVYINLVEHPARLSCGTEAAARQWAPSYRRATVMQASLAVVAALAGLARWLGGGGASWAIGALAIGAVVPFTLLVIARTNGRLLEPDRDLGSPENAPPAPRVGTPARRAQRFERRRRARLPGGACPLAPTFPGPPSSESWTAMRPVTTRLRPGASDQEA